MALVLSGYLNQAVIREANHNVVRKQERLVFTSKGIIDPNFLRFDDRFANFLEADPVRFPVPDRPYRHQLYQVYESNDAHVVLWQTPQDCWLMFPCPVNPPLEHLRRDSRKSGRLIKRIKTFGEDLFRDGDHHALLRTSTEQDAP
jgi:hypothetical protein